MLVLKTSAITSTVTTLYDGIRALYRHTRVAVHYSVMEVTSNQTILGGARSLATLEKRHRELACPTWACKQLVFEYMILRTSKLARQRKLRSVLTFQTFACQHRHGDLLYTLHDTFDPLLTPLS
eukprot:COSAG05_NODE_3012_length_2416_cov_8.168680_1_plen_124_part_00